MDTVNITRNVLGALKDTLKTLDYLGADIAAAHVQAAIEVLRETSGFCKHISVSDQASEDASPH